MFLVFPFNKYFCEEINFHMVKIVTFVIFKKIRYMNLFREMSICILNEFFCFSKSNIYFVRIFCNRKTKSSFNFSLGFVEEY